MSTWTFLGYTALFMLVWAAAALLIGTVIDAGSNDPGDWDA